MTKSKLNLCLLFFSCGDGIFWPRPISQSGTKCAAVERVEGGERQSGVSMKEKFRVIVMNGGRCVRGAHVWPVEFM